VDPDWVDDMAQETFLVAWQRLDEFDRSRDFGKWIRGIARHLAANERRKRGRRLRILSEHLYDILSVHCPDDEPGDPEETRRMIRAMRECLAGLPKRSRALLMRRYREEHNASAIARSLRMTSAAVRKRLSRLRRAVQDCIREKVGSVPA
jgi:RNA polymerase sigma-70 factor (ECF subfamily)